MAARYFPRVNARRRVTHDAVRGHILPSGGGNIDSATMVESSALKFLARALDKVIHRLENL